MNACGGEQVLEHEPGELCPGHFVGLCVETGRDCAHDAWYECAGPDSVRCHCEC